MLNWTSLTLHQNAFQMSTCTYALIWKEDLCTYAAKVMSY